MSSTEWAESQAKIRRETPGAVRASFDGEWLQTLEFTCYFLHPSPTVAYGAGCDTKSAPFITAILPSIASLWFSSACGVSSSIASVTQTEVTAASLKIDVGVILTDRANYLYTSRTVWILVIPTPSKESTILHGDPQ